MTNTTDRATIVGPAITVGVVVPFTLDGRATRIGPGRASPP
jgi:hypothetical protein